MIHDHAGCSSVFWESRTLQSSPPHTHTREREWVCHVEGGKPTTSAAATAATGGDTGTKPQRKIKFHVKGKPTHDAATSRPSAPSPSATAATGATGFTGAAGEGEVSGAEGTDMSGGATMGGAGASGEGNAAHLQSQLDSKSQEEQGGGGVTTGTGATRTMRPKLLNFDSVAKQQSVSQCAEGACLDTLPSVVQAECCAKN